jgi:hypothetical protein
VHVSLITGSRKWPATERDAIHAALRGSELLIVGDAPGVDSIALDWALANDVIVHVYCADQRRFDLLNGLPQVYVEQASDWRRKYPQGSAGTVRNARMVKAAFDMQTTLQVRVQCHAFPLAGSSGTWDCYQRCKAAGLDVTLHPPGEDTDA